MIVDLLYEKKKGLLVSLSFVSRIKTGPDIDILMQSRWQAGLILLEITCISFHILPPSTTAESPVKLCICVICRSTVTAREYEA